VLIGEEASARLAAACVVAAYISGGVLYLCGLCEVSKSLLQTVVLVASVTFASIYALN
jgi:hypothetical protein